MNTKMKLLLTALFVGAFALTSSAEIVGIFHTGANPGEVYTAAGLDPQPTAILAGGSGVYGDLTLTLDAAQPQFKLTVDSDVNVFEEDPALVSMGSLANDNWIDNGLDMDGDTLPGPFTHTLSGLSIGQEYRIQYMGTMRYPINDTLLNIHLDAFEGASLVASGDLSTVSHPRVSSGDRDWNHYSSYVEWTATQGTLDLTLVSSGSTDNKMLTGIVVQAIPEPATMGLMVVVGGGMLFFRRRLKI